MHAGERRWLEGPDAVPDSAAPVSLEDFSAALDDGGQLALDLQPIRDLASGGLAGGELLLRWTHPVRGPLPPSRFLPRAEAEAPEIVDRLGAWLVRRAADALPRWVDLNPGAFLAINVSPRQLRDVAAATRFTAAVEEAVRRLPPGALVLEITERYWFAPATAPAAREAAEADFLSRLASLRGAGARIALDDFGEGDPAERHLGLPLFDLVKLAPRWVRRAARTAAAAERRELERLVARVQDRGGAAVVEGIENAGERGAARAAGAAFGQGYDLGRPRPLAAVIAGGGEPETGGAGAPEGEPEP